MNIQDMYGEYIQYLKKNRGRVNVILTGASSEKWFQFELYYLLSKHLSDGEYIQNERLTFDHLILKRKKGKDTLLTAIEMKMVHLDYRNDNSTISIQKLYAQLKKKTGGLRSKYSFSKGSKDHCKGLLLIRGHWKESDPIKLDDYCEQQKERLSQIREKLLGKYEFKRKRDGKRVKIGSRFRFLDKETLNIGKPDIEGKVRIGDTDHYVWLWTTMLRAI